jgi:hypothetical protein
MTISHYPGWDKSCHTPTYLSLKSVFKFILASSVPTKAEEGSWYILPGPGGLEGGTGPFYFAYDLSFSVVSDVIN